MDAHSTTPSRPGTDLAIPKSIDSLALRRFALRSACVYLEAALPGPYLIGMMLRTTRNVVPAYADDLIPGAEVHGPPIPPGNYPFPIMQADTLVGVDKIIQPLCHQAHQLFGRDSSPCFTPEGRWNRD